MAERERPITIRTIKGGKGDFPAFAGCIKQVYAKGANTMLFGKKPSGVEWLVVGLGNPG